MNSLIQIALAAATVLGAADPFMGTWQLNRAQSHYEAAEIPERMMIVMTPDEAGVHYHSETTWRNGRIGTSDYSTNYAGTVATVRGRVGILAPVAVQRIAPNTVVANYFSGLRVVATSRRVVSADGKLLTITTLSSASDGTPRTNLAVFKRVAN